MQLQVTEGDDEQRVKITTDLPGASLSQQSSTLCLALCKPQAYQTPSLQPSAEAPIFAGKLVLHWGVEGGKDYKGGWRLPAESCWPQDTVMYKNRALQSPCRCPSLPYPHSLTSSQITSPPQPLHA